MTAQPPTRLRLCFVLGELRLSGGVQVVLEFARRLADRGHEVAVVTSLDRSDPAALEPPSGVALIAIRRRLEHRLLRANLGLAIELASAIPPSDFVIATHTPTMPIVLAACVLLRRGRPLWLCQDYPEMFDGRPVERAVFRWAPRAFDAALCISDATAIDAWRGGQRNVVVVGEGLGEWWWHLARTPAARDPHSVLYLGDDRPRKGLADVVAAMREVRAAVPEARLVVATKQEDLTVDVPGAEVIIRPSQDELARLYATCGVFVSASWVEGFCLPPLEAMAFGAPVVVTDSRGVREYAADGENCLLVAPRAPSKLASAIARLLHDRDLAARLGKQGIATAARFTWDEPVSRFERALSTLSAGKR